MRAVIAAAALLVTGCRVDLTDCAKDHSCQGAADSNTGAVCMTSTVQICMDATMHSDLTWVQDNIFTKQCIFTGCHNGGTTDAGRVDLRSGMSLTHLVDFPSRLEPSRKLVVAGDVAKSYLMVMLGAIKPSEADPPAPAVNPTIGLMPMDNNGALLCCQKIDAIKRWIEMGAMNN